MCAKWFSLMPITFQNGHYKTLQANLAQDIVSPPRPGSEGTMPWNALPADEVEEVKMFIRNYAFINGLPQPAAPRGHNKQAPTYLPCVTTKKQVHAEYSKAGGKWPTVRLPSYGAKSARILSSCFQRRMRAELVLITKH